MNNNIRTAEVVRYIGLMSGTSLDGVDAALVSFKPSGAARLEGQVYLPFPDELRQQLLALNSSGNDEVERSCIQANSLARLYADSVAALLQQSGLKTSDIIAIGSHGQTIRHRPELGFTVQIGNSALLAELSHITVISDFRSRDIAAGGQGAPLAPAFHHAVFAHPAIHRVIVNIGGISNLTSLPPCGNISGFDCGPANLLMDAWTQRHLRHGYDKDGEWASSGQVIESLLTTLLAHPFFRQPPPKSTGRDTFNLSWFEQHLKAQYRPADVQATLLELAARGIADAIQKYCQDATEIFLCGGGARNLALRSRLQELCKVRKIALTDDLGIGVDWVEAVAFAWLAKQTMEKLPSNLPAVTGAQGPRILGAIYPA